MILLPMKGDETVVLFDPMRPCSAANPIRAHLPSNRGLALTTACGRPVEYGETRLPWRLVAGTTLVKVCGACRKVLGKETG